jgi:dephospho-CoA kinase
MIRIGVTGGIGSGKSLICRVFSQLGVPVYSADDAAKNLMEHDPQIRKDLTGIFDASIYEGEKLNRSKLAGLIFENPELLARVNRIVHPRVAHDFNNWCSSFPKAPFVIQESAILFESNAFKSVDHIILVTAPEEMRIQRVLSRPGMTREKVLRIMKNQLPEEEKIVRSHFIINNDETTLILPIILSIYAEMRQDKLNLQE